jgi:hypothetical protein
MSAHLAVTEALMMLFIRELAPPARVLAAVRRYSKTEEVPADSEEALIFWVNQSCQAVRYARLSVFPAYFLENFPNFWARIFPFEDSLKYSIAES